jgi:cyclopropane fatty-acyl-phospholipid synthase-like methyltransferase
MSDEAGRTARAAYRDASRATRLHVAIRWRTCPFAPIADALGDAARVLDIGCGHGLFPVYLARRFPGPTITGVDIDRDKLTIARAAARVAGLEDRVQFEAVEPGWVPGEGTPGAPAAGWDGIAVVDVLYLLGPERVSRLLAAAAGALAPGGKLVVKELDTAPVWKHRVSQAQEFVATRVARITEGEHNQQVPSETLAADLEALGLVVTTTRLDRGKLHPDYLTVATRTAQ